jgi:hypothetical protein
MKQNQAPMWVCQCCMLIHANGECGDEGHDWEPWKLIDFEKYEVTMGLLATEHNETCEVRKTGSHPDNYECDCETRTFDASMCDGCGSPFHGERHAFTIWYD